MSLLKEISITELSNLRIGHASDYNAQTGVTVLYFPQGAKVGCDISGGGPASRETPLTSPVTADNPINAIVLSGGSAYGLDSADAYCAVFDRYVKSPLLVKNFETLCNRWRKLSVGALSPNFNCTDLSGKKVSLSDFKGKYVYIDIWATWCGPCQREIPHLQKLEEKYHGKDIYFVSISCDNNKKAWENRVRAGLKGIQLHFVNGDTFMNDYMIKGIPRFILLDKEGKIISVDMSRPSDPKTIAKLDELLN